MKTLILAVATTIITTGVYAQEVFLNCTYTTAKGTQIQEIMLNPSTGTASNNGYTARLRTDGVKYQFKIIANKEADRHLTAVHTIDRTDLSYTRMSIESMDKGQCVKADKKPQI